MGKAYLGIPKEVIFWTKTHEEGRTFFPVAHD